MLITKEFIIIFVISYLIYFLFEIIISDALLYITGGLIVGSINKVLKLFSINSNYIPYLIWFFILIGLIILFLKLKNKLLKYFLIIIIGLFLFIIDFGIHRFVSYDSEIKYKLIINSNFKANTLLQVIILVKCFTLSSIYYMKKE